MEDCGCSELFFTSDNEQGILNGAVDGGAYITAPEKIVSSSFSSLRLELGPCSCLFGG